MTMYGCPSKTAMFHIVRYRMEAKYVKILKIQALDFNLFKFSRQLESESGKNTLKILVDPVPSHHIISNGGNIFFLRFHLNIKLFPALLYGNERGFYAIVLALAMIRKANHMTCKSKKP